MKIVNFGDGFGSDYHGADKASEDHIVINGEIYKLDVSEMEYDPEDYLKPRKIRTKTPQNLYQTKKFPERHCEVSFESVGTLKDGVNLVALSFSQTVVYGYFSGSCQLEEGRTVSFSKVFGHVEHMSTRW